MRTLLLAFALFVVPVLSLAGEHAPLYVALPRRPALADVQPGIQVVMGVEEEVFYTDQHYWVRRDGDWYRAKQPAGEFTYVESSHVPSGLMELEPGEYGHDHLEAAHDEEDGYDHRGHDHGGHGGCGSHGSHGHAAH